MESCNDTEEVSDCNTNAQIAPERIHAVDGSAEMNRSYREQIPDEGQRSSMCNGLSPGETVYGEEDVLNEAISLHDNELAELEVRFMSQSLIGEVDREETYGESDSPCQPDDHDTQSLSDDTSSMSETELSDDSENANGDDFDGIHLKLSQATTTLNDENESGDTDGETGSDAGGKISDNIKDDIIDPQQSPSGDDTSNISAFDDTFTDLTLDSINLSLMDSWRCFMDTDISGNPEISNLEITCSDISYSELEFSEFHSALEVGEDNSGDDDSCAKETSQTPESDEVTTNSESAATSVNGENGQEIPTSDPSIHGVETSMKEADSITDEPAESPKSKDDSAIVPAQEMLKDEGNETGSDEVTSTTDTDNINPAVIEASASVAPHGGHIGYNPNQSQVMQNDNAGPAQHMPMLYPPPQFGYQWPVDSGQLHHYNHHHQQQQQPFPVADYQQQQQQQPYYDYGTQQYQPTMMWQNSIYGYPLPQTGYHYPSYNTDQSIFDPDQFYPGQLQDQQGPEPTCTNKYVPQFEAQPEASSQQMQNFQYPSVYVSQAGLITVLLKNDVSVEFTVDKTIRMVSHQRRLVIATNSRGSANCLYHPHAKVCHDGTTTEVELSDERKVRMTTENIVIAKGEKCYRFDYNDVQDVAVDFRDISKDNSVTLLFGSSSYGPALIPQCLELAQNAQYNHYEDGSFNVRINGISISQTSRGDVIVSSGPKFLKMASQSSYLRLQTHFIDMAVYKNAKIFVRRGTHSLDSNPSSLFVNNGNLEAGFEDGNDLSVFRLPRRTPLNALSRRQRRPAVPRERQSSRRDWY